jgi:hypothetical protein
MHCDVCLDRLPKLPAFDDASNHSSMQDRFLEFGASPLLHACQTYLSRDGDAGFSFLLACPRILTSKTPDFFRDARLVNLILTAHNGESRNLRTAAGTFWSASWHAATPIDP